MRPQCKRWLVHDVLSGCVQAAKASSSPLKVAKKILKQLKKNASVCPYELRYIFSAVSHSAANQFPEMRWVVLGSFVFLRWIGPALATPVESGVCLKEPSKHVKAVLLSALRLLLCKVNSVEFVVKSEVEEKDAQGYGPFTDPANYNEIESCFIGLIEGIEEEVQMTKLGSKANQLLGAASAKEKIDDDEVVMVVSKVAATPLTRSGNSLDDRGSDDEMTETTNISVAEIVEEEDKEEGDVAPKVVAKSEVKNPLWTDEKAVAAQRDVVSSVKNPLWTEEKAAAVVAASQVKNPLFSETAPKDTTSSVKNPLWTEDKANPATAQRDGVSQVKNPLLRQANDEKPAATVKNPLWSSDEKPFQNFTVPKPKDSRQSNGDNNAFVKRRTSNGQMNPSPRGGDDEKEGKKRFVGLFDRFLSGFTEDSKTGQGQKSPRSPRGGDGVPKPSKPAFELKALSSSTDDGGREYSVRLKLGEEQKRELRAIIVSALFFVHEECFELAKDEVGSGLQFQLLQSVTKEAYAKHRLRQRAKEQTK